MTTRVLNAQELEFEYDADSDVLYVSVGGRGADDALTYETDEGHLVRVDPDTGELIGVTILDYRECWEGRALDLEWSGEVSRGGWWATLTHLSHHRTRQQRRHYVLRDPLVR